MARLTPCQNLASCRGLLHLADLRALALLVQRALFAIRAYRVRATFILRDISTPKIRQLIANSALDFIRPTIVIRKLAIQSLLVTIAKRIGPT